MAASEATLCGEQMRKPGSEFMVRDDDVDIFLEIGLNLNYPNSMWEIKLAKFKTLPSLKLCKLNNNIEQIGNPYEKLHHIAIPLFSYAKLCFFLQVV